MRNQVSVDYVLFKLNEVFKVVDISSELIVADNIENAEEICLRRNLDRVPIKKEGKIVSYFELKTRSESVINQDSIMADSKGILDAFIYLSKRDFYFIESEKELTHIVHYSDLNRPISLLSIYAQIAYCEMFIRDFARINNLDNTEDGIKKFVNDLNKRIRYKKNKINIEKAITNYKRKSAEVRTDLFDELFFDDELLLFRELVTSKLDSTKLKKFNEFIRLDYSKINTFRKLRNKIMHSQLKIVNAHSDIYEWLNLLHTCQNIINVINKKTVFY